MEKKDVIGTVGAGLIGRAWACVFARAGHPVQLWDPEPALRARCGRLGFPGTTLFRKSYEDAEHHSRTAISDRN